jgi:hypothetical protein
MVVVWYSLWSFGICIFLFGMFGQRKIWQPWLKLEEQKRVLFSNEIMLFCRCILDELDIGEGSNEYHNFQKKLNVHPDAGFEPESSVPVAVPMTV